MGRLVRLPICHDWGFIERAVWTGDPTFLLSPIPAGSHKDASLEMMCALEATHLYRAEL